MPCHLECWKKRKRANKMEIGKKKLLVQNLLLRILGGNLPTIPRSQIWNVLESTKNCEGCIFLAKVEMDNKTSASWPSRFQVQQKQIGGGTLPTEKDVYNKLRIRKGIRQVFKQHPTIYDRGTLRELFSITQEAGIWQVLKQHPTIYDRGTLREIF